MNVEKLTPAIKAKVAERNSITAKRKQLADEQAALLKRIEGVKASVTSLQQKADSILLKGQKADDCLREFNTKIAEIQACERQLKRLADQDGEIAIKEKTANTELSKAIDEAITALWDDTRNRILDLFKEGIATLLLYQQIDEQHLSQDQFVNFHQWIKVISGYVSPKKSS